MLGVTFCSLPANNVVEPATPNEVKVFPSGAVAALYQRTSNYNQDSSEEVTLSLSLDGKNFSSRTLKPLVQGGYQAQYFLRSEFDFYAANHKAVVYKTNDSGQSWSPFPFATNFWGVVDQSNFHWVQFADINSGIRFSSARTSDYSNFNSYMERTTDGGNTWEQTDLSSQFYSVSNVLLKSSQEVILIGSIQGQIGVTRIYHSNDAGRTFVQTNGAVASYAKFSFLDASNGWVFSISNPLLRTGDGGLTWTSVTHNLTGGSFQVVKFLNTTTGYALYGPYQSYKFYKTTDGGTNWTLIQLPFSNGGLDGTFDAGAGKIYIAYKTKLFVSNDEFATYEEADPGLKLREYSYSNAVVNPACFMYSL
ncbi:hypothetical protein DLM75_06080 [Leptospira stimsonii]|uniref:Photosynthesis system II assembly factor Ycf48/Hcf136-like domain-containing protein n=2 Tax=Leptospira stimsonii TaxID=2202203 RepID=A0A396ZHE4_9LEPT|nr:hypothetical protein DLM75_06080 [Leptospira stimsonii]